MDEILQLGVAPEDDVAAAAGGGWNDLLERRRH